VERSIENQTGFLEMVNCQSRTEVVIEAVPKDVTSYAFKTGSSDTNCAFTDNSLDGITE